VHLKADDPAGGYRYHDSFADVLPKDDRIP
jgi:hypothetical protein